MNVGIRFHQTIKNIKKSIQYFFRKNEVLISIELFVCLDLESSIAVKTSKEAKYRENVERP